MATRVPGTLALGISDSAMPYAISRIFDGVVSERITCATECLMQSTNPALLESRPETSPERGIIQCGPWLLSTTTTRSLCRRRRVLHPLLPGPLVLWLQGVQKLTRGTTAGGSGPST